MSTLIVVMTKLLCPAQYLSYEQGGLLTFHVPSNTGVEQEYFTRSPGQANAVCQRTAEQSSSAAEYNRYR